MSRNLELPPVEIQVESRALVRDRARGRSKLVGAMVGLALVAIGCRGVLLCVRPAQQVIDVGMVQRYDQVVLRAARGEILDREGRRLATSVDTPTVAVDPEMIKADEVDSLAASLARILDLPVEEVREKMLRKGRYVKVAARVHPAIAAEVQRLGHHAVWTHSDPRRYYPEETLGSQVIGFVDAGGHGRAGLEQYLDEQLRGGSIVVQRRRDQLGLDVDRPATWGNTTNHGLNVHTTLDRQIQHAADEALATVMLESAPLSVSAVVVDVRTGDILAMANAPEFNPNARSEEDVASRKNHIVMDAIEPGSIFKPFTIAAAVEEGIVTPDSIIDCEGGQYYFNGGDVGDDHPKGLLTVTEIMKYSSNIGVTKLAFQLGAHTFIDYLHKFGFGERTGVPLYGERRGMIRNPDKIRPIELANTSFGQGATASPLQMAMAIAALGNDGIRMRPRLVSRVEAVDGVAEVRHEPQEVMRAVSVETAQKTVAMMQTVTETGGTGTRGRVPGFRVAGKTGTAQKVKNGVYSEARISSFVGLIPAEDPVLAIVVIVDEPTQGSKYGGIAAAPAFAHIAKRSMQILGISPDPVLLAEEKKVPVAELPRSTPREPVRLTWAGDAWSVPDFSGRSVRDVLVGLEGSGLRVEFEGSGVAIAQKPDPGEHLAPGQSVSVVFQ